MISFSESELAERDRQVAEKAWDERRNALVGVLTAPPADLSLDVGGQEYVATSVIAVLLEEQPNPYRKERR